VLTEIAETVVKAILGAVIIGFSVYCLASRSQYELKNDRLAWLFGFCAGVLGGAYGMNGPPLAGRTLQIRLNYCKPLDLVKCTDPKILRSFAG
jgi:uncharacterized membrane protein YfcA